MTSYYKRFLEQKSKEIDGTRITKELIYNIIDNKNILEVYINKNGFVNQIDKFPNKFINSFKLNRTVKRLILHKISCRDLSPLISVFKFNRSIITLKLCICNILNLDTIITLLTNKTSILYLYLTIDRYCLMEEVYNEDSKYYKNEEGFVETFINKINLILDTLKTNNRLNLLYFYGLSITSFKYKIDEIYKINKRVDIKFLN